MKRYMLPRHILFALSAAWVVYWMYYFSIQKALLVIPFALIAVTILGIVEKYSSNIAYTNGDGK